MQARPNVDMRRFWLPDYEKKLIAELQRQQNCAQFCDTLLQTEGISIPTHSSVLGALSLPLFKRLASSPAPPAGQKRKLQLHGLRPQTLVKLVGLLYSGELQVDGAVEQRDVLSAAHSFGLSDLIEGVKSEVQGSQELCKQTKDKRDMQIQVMPKSFHVSFGTQTENEDASESLESSQHLKTATASSLLTSRSISEQKIFETLSSTSRPLNSSECSDDESTHEQLSDGLTSTTSSLLCPSEKMTLRLSPSESSNCSRLLEGEVQPSVPGTSAEAAKEGPAVEEEEERTVSGNTERSYQDYRERGSAVEKKLLGKNVANRSMEKMQEMLETTQISIKVKLRRSRAKEEIWEVVNNIPAPDVTALIPDSYRRLQEDLTAVQPSPSTAVVGRSFVPQPKRRSPKPGLTSDDSSEPSGTLSDDPMSVPLQLPRPLEETDEQIDKLLEDIMIGLNILPNMEKSSNKARDRDRSQAGDNDQKEKASYCACYGDYGNRNGNSSTHKAVHEPGCTVYLSTEPSRVSNSFNTTLENSSASTRIADGSQNSKTPQSSTGISDNDNSNSQEDPNVLELLPLTTENEANLFSIADLQFLPCLSPLDSNNNATSGNKTLALSPLPSKTWLMDNPFSLEFPMKTTGQKQKNSPPKSCTPDSVEEYTRGSEPDGLSAKSPAESKAKRTLDNKEGKRKCPNRRSNETWRSKDATITLSHCKVRLSSNNVLAEERKQLCGTKPSNAATTENQKSTQTRSSQPETRWQRYTVARTPIRTRNKSQQASMTSTPNPDTCVTGRKRGRPRKSQNLEQTETKRETRKRPREKVLEEGPSEKAIPMDTPSVVKVDHNGDTTDDNDNTIPAEKRPRLVSLKEFQELIKRQHSKTRRKNDHCEKEPSENTENSEREGDSVLDPIEEAASCQSDKVDMTKCVDRQNDHEKVLNQPANFPKTPPQADHNRTSSSSGNNESSEQSEFCLGGEVTKLSEGTEETLKTQPMMEYDDAVTDSASENEIDIEDEDSFSLIASGQQENHSAHSTPNLTSTKNQLKMDTQEVMPRERSAGRPQDDEVEVDVLLHSSPERASVTTERHKMVEISADEEEGEDSNEVDVTGSETDA